VAGSWPRGIDGIALERSAFGVAQATLGHPIEIQVANRPAVALQVSASVHDPSLAPAWQEQAVYGYLSPEAAFAVSGEANLHILKLTVTSPIATRGEIETTARAEAQNLAQSGHVVREIRVPPPRTHPHQTQMMTFLILLVAFSSLGLLLGSVLAAAIMQGLIAQHARDIALLKVVGATTGQITAQYLTLLATVALLATGLALPMGLRAGHAWVRASAALLNLDIRSEASAPWVIVTIIAAGLLVPLGTALHAILGASRCTVREALGNRDILRPSTGSHALLGLLIRLRLFSIEAAYACRNAFRRPGRLALGAALLATAGGIFIAGENLRTAWTANIAAAAAHRHYDVELDLENPEPREKVLGVIDSMDGVLRSESWAYADVSADGGDHVAVSSIYPDEGHGRIRVRTPPPDTRLQDFDVVAGRWIRAGETDAIVMNEAAQASGFPGARPGDWIDVLIGHEPKHVHVVGLTRELLTPGIVYASADVGAGLDRPATTTNAIRIALKPGASVGDFTHDAQARLASAGIRVRGIVTQAMMRGAQTGHIRILLYALDFIAALNTLIGLLGLTALFGINLAERMREFGVLRAIGATAWTFRRLLAYESVLSALLGTLFAVPVSFLLSALLAVVIRRVSGQTLAMPLGVHSILLWLIVAMAVAMVAILYPAARANRVTVREALETL
jgi:putative ABC transport system permease protein